jgi:ankyrin repeat protein
VNVKTKFETSALHFACLEGSAGYVEIVQLLLKHEGIDVNARDYANSTALHFACQEKSVEIVQLLLKKPKPKINQKVSSFIYL